MHTSVVRFEPARRADFFRLHSSHNDAGWCHCVAWWVGTWDGWGERSVEDNLALRNRLLDAGEYDGYLLYVDDQPAGWCQVGPRDRLSKLAQQFHLAPDAQTWAITCFLIAPAYRRQGLAAHLLRDVLIDLRARDVQRVEAFPKRGAQLEVDDLWNGPEAMFIDAGFQVVRDDATRPVLSIDLAGPPDCFVCRKHRGEIDIPGGAIYQDDHIYIGHIAPSNEQDATYLGYLMLEPKRHVAGLSDLNRAEAQMIGEWMTRLSRALKSSENAEHVYSFVLGDNVAHLHIHIVPRYAGAPREYWGVRVDEWRDAPHGDVQAVIALCARLRAWITHDRDSTSTHSS